MFLSDVDILRKIEEGEIKIDPFERENLGAVSYDLRLHKNFRVFKADNTTHIDVKKEFEVTKAVDAGERGEFVIHPGQFVLGATYEKIELSSSMAGLLEGRSSLARIGLIVHATAGLVNPGTSGHITFEMTNISNLPVKLYVGMRVAQMIFVPTTSPTSVGYGSGRAKYQQQEPPTSSRIWKDFE